MDPAVKPSSDFADVVGDWRGAAVSPNGEITLPVAGDEADMEEIIRFLESLRAEGQ
jgi:predicted alpha/beta-fold hydrolase